jgi:hypothetical protein
VQDTASRVVSSPGRFTTGYGTILVLDAEFNLLGAWTG